MKKTAILIIMCGTVAMAQMLPGDGAKVTVYSLDAEIAITQYCRALVYL